MMNKYKSHCCYQPKIVIESSSLMIGLIYVCETPTVRYISTKGKADLIFKLE